MIGLNGAITKKVTNGSIGLVFQDKIGWCAWNERLRFKGSFHCRNNTFTTFFNKIDVVQPERLFYLALDTNITEVDATNVTAVKYGLDKRNIEMVPISRKCIREIGESIDVIDHVMRLGTLCTHEAAAKAVIMCEYIRRNNI